MSRVYLRAATSAAGAQGAAWIYLPYVHSAAAATAASKLDAERRCIATDTIIIGYETGDHWPGVGSGTARGGPHGGPAAGGQRPGRHKQRGGPYSWTGDHRRGNGIDRGPSVPARCGPGHGWRGTRSGRIPEAVPQGGEQHFPRGGRGLLPAVRGGVRELGMAAAGRGGSGAGACKLPGLRGNDAAVSLSDCELVLAGEAEVVRRISRAVGRARGAGLSCRETKRRNCLDSRQMPRNHPHSRI